MQKLKTFIKKYNRHLSMAGIVLALILGFVPQEAATEVPIENVEPVEEKESTPRNADQQIADTIGAALDKSFGNDAHYSIDVTDEKAIVITITVDGMGASAEMAKNDETSKADWKELVSAMKEMSSGFKKGAESYGSKKDISVILVNDENPDEVLVGTMNDTVFMDILATK